MRWIILAVLLTGCGPSQLQVHREALLDAGPGIEFIVARSPIEPVLVDCLGDLKPATQRWRAAHLVWVQARADSNDADAAWLDLRQARLRALKTYDYRDALTDCGVNVPPKTPANCREPAAFNHAVLALSEFEDQLRKALNPQETAQDHSSARRRLVEAARPPFADRVWYLIGTLDMRTGRFGAAREAFSKVSSASDLVPETAMRIAKIDASAGAHDAALVQYQRALKAKRPLLRAGARFGQARSQFITGKTAIAVQTLVDLAAQEPTRDLGQLAAWLLASDWDGPEDTQGDPSLARLHRFVPNDDPVHHEIIRRTIEEWVAGDRPDLALTAADALIKAAPLSAELPGVLRARLRILDAQSAEAGLKARMTLSAHFTPAWFEAHHARPAAIRAATALMDASDQAAANALIAWKRLPEAAVHTAAWRSRRVQPPPKPIQPTTDGNRPAEVAQELMRMGHFDAAATVWLSLAETRPVDAVTAHFNSMVALAKADRLVEARQAASRVLGEGSRTPEARPAARAYANISELLFDFETAITAWVAFAHKAQGTHEAVDALAHAATLAEALGRPRQAAALLEEVLQAAPAQTTVLLKIARLHAQANAPDARRATLERLAKIQTNPTAMLQARALLAEMKTGAARAKAFSRLVEPTRTDAKLGMPDPTQTRLHAQALFEVSEPKFQAFVAPTRWPADPQARSAHLDRLQQQLRAIQAQYGAIFDLRNLEWSLAAGTRLAALFSAFARHIDQSPPPNKLTTEERAHFHTLLRRVSDPVQLKAVNAYKAVVERGAGLPDSRWVKQARAALCNLAQCPVPILAPAPIPTARSLPLFVRLEGAEHAPAHALLTAGVKAVDAGRRADAEDIFARAAARHPDLVEAELNVALLHQWRGKSGRLALARAQRMDRLPAAVSMVEAMEHWRAGTLTPGAAFADDARIRIALRAQTPTARAEAKVRFEAAPRARFARLNRLRAALQTRPAIARFMGEMSWVRADALAADLVAETLLAEGHTSRARALLYDATRRPGGAHAEAYARLATIEATHGRVSEARSLLKEALSRQPGLAAAQANLDQLAAQTPVAQ